MIAIAVHLSLLYTTFSVGAGPTAAALDFGAASIRPADTAQVRSFISHLVGGLYLCSAKSELAIAQSELALLQGKKLDPKEVVAAQSNCQDSVMVVGDSLLRPLRDGRLEARQREVLLDTYAFWRAAMLEIVPRGTEAMTTRGDLYMRRVQLIMDEVGRRIQRLRVEFL